MLFKTLSAAVYGIDANIIEVEVDVSGIRTNEDHFHTVGLPDAAVRESRERIRAALKNCGYDIPPTHITINLAPADIKKEGSGFDLPMALGILGCYGALNKGTQALWLEVLVAAERLGIAGLLDEQLQHSQGDRYKWALGQFPILPPKAYRWVPEMLEIAKTFEGAGMTPRIFEGAADMYTFIAGTAIGRETPENRDKSRSGRDVVKLLADDARR